MEVSEKVHFFSASQINAFLDCPRKWAYQYIARRPRTQHASAELGTQVHKILEDYLRDGTPLPYSDPEPMIARAAQIAGSGIHLLPAPKTPGMSLERGFAFETSFDPPLHFHGYKDIEMAPGDGREIPEVWDHKTTSDMKWSKTEAQLREDVQALLYAYEAMIHYRTSTISMNWVYYQTRGASRAKKVHLKLTSEYVTPLFLAFLPVLQFLKSTLQSKADPLSLPADATHCSAYNGCPFREECAPHIDPKEKARAAMTAFSTQATSLLDKLKARQAQVQGPPSVAAGTVLTISKDDFAKGLANGDIRPSSKPVPAINKIDAVLAGKEFAERNSEVLHELAKTDIGVSPPAINPPGEFQPAPTAEERAAADIEAKVAKSTRGRPQGSKNKPKVDAPLVATEPTAFEVDIDAAQIERLGAKVEQLGLSYAPPVTAVSVPAINRAELIHAQHRVSEGAVLVASTPKGFKLFIDCLPVSSSITMAEELYSDVKKRIVEKHKVPDYRFISYTGAAVFQQELQGLVDEGQVTGNIFLDSSTPEGMLAMAILAPAASFPVVRGMR